METKMKNKAKTVVSTKISGGGGGGGGKPNS